MSQDGVMPKKFVWFCRECGTKGQLLGDGIVDIMMAENQHRIGSPGCDDLLRIAKKEDVEKDPFIPYFTNWDD